MEIVAAADSDERGLSLLKVVNVLQRVVVFIHSFTIDKFKGNLQRPSGATQEMPHMREEDIAVKVGFCFSPMFATHTHTHTFIPIYLIILVWV